MKVIITETAQEAGTLAADLIASGVREGRISNLGVATGSSPAPIYEALARAPRGTYSHLSLFALDEYVGLDPDDRRSYFHTVSTQVAVPLGIGMDRLHVPDGQIESLKTAGSRFEQTIAESGGIDLQIVGIGSNGHIGFNEPSSSLTGRTRVKTLSEETRIDNARFFESLGDVPLHCVTQGVGTIMAARELLLIATGPSKATPIKMALEGPLSTMCPASAIQAHPQATVILDEAAAADLALADYHRLTHTRRPNWQLI